MFPSLRSSFSVFLMLEDVKVFPASQKFSPFGAGGKVPLACKGESCSCTVVSGTVPHVWGWYSTKIYVWGAVPHCTSCLQGRVVATGRWLRLPSHNSMVCFTKYLVHCSTVLGMLQLVPGTVILGTNKPYNRSSGPPCRLLYFCTPHTLGPRHSIICHSEFDGKPLSIITRAPGF